MSNVEIVLTDEREIFARQSIPAVRADSTIELLNKAAGPIARGTARWRRAVSTTDPGRVCETCGAKHCPGHPDERFRR